MVYPVQNHSASDLPLFNMKDEEICEALDLQMAGMLFFGMALDPVKPEFQQMKIVRFLA